MMETIFAVFGVVVAVGVVGLFAFDAWDNRKAAKLYAILLKNIKERTRLHAELDELRVERDEARADFLEALTERQRSPEEAARRARQVRPILKGTPPVFPSSRTHRGRPS